MPETSKAVGGKGKTPVHIDADEVQVVSTMEVPEGHVVVEPPTAATPAITMPESDARAAEVAVESETALRSQAAREETILRTQGQRDTSNLWESTQMRLALLMVGGFMLAHVAIVLAIGWVLVTRWELLAERPAALGPLIVILTAALGAIATLAASVAASYFSRTNSHRTGGVGGDDVKTDR